MAEYYQGADALASSSAFGGFSVTPSDSTDLAINTRAIRVSGAGNVKVTGVDGNTWTAAFLAGETRALRVKRIWSTGTTATGIEGMY